MFGNVLRFIPCFIFDSMVFAMVRDGLRFEYRLGFSRVFGSPFATLAAVHAATTMAIGFWVEQWRARTGADRGRSWWLWFARGGWRPRTPSSGQDQYSRTAWPAIALTLDH